MNKAVLVMDMPERCRDCIFFIVIDIAKACCKITESPCDKDLCRYIDVAFSCEKPDWCPLRQMPEKVTEDGLECYGEMKYMQGWNACIDAIGGGDGE